MNAAAPRPRVVMVGAVPMSALVAEVAEPRAVLVALHGGASSSAYFDCPGNPRLSLLRMAASLGYTAIALDRPGYGASALYQDEMARSERRVELAYGALDKIVDGGGRGAGTFLVGHSAGCELAVRMAVAERSDLLGLEVAGTGLRYHADAKTVLDQATSTYRPAGLRDLLWQPTALYPPEVLTGALSAPGVAYEAEATSNWPKQDFAVTAAHVRVPVQISVADHEAVWDCTPQALADVVALFTSSARVLLNEVADSGHNVSVGLSAESYHRRVLEFAGECISDHEGAQGRTDVELETT